MCYIIDHQSLVVCRHNYIIYNTTLPVTRWVKLSYYFELLVPK